VNLQKAKHAIRVVFYFPSFARGANKDWELIVTVLHVSMAPITPRAASRHTRRHV
jgi:hypothetical protein